MKRLLTLLAIIVGTIGAAAGNTVVGAFFTTDGQNLYELPYPYVATTYERPDAGTIVIRDFWQSGRDLTVSLGSRDDAGYYSHLTLDLPGGHDHYGHHYYLCPDYSSIAAVGSETSDSFFADYCFYYRDDFHDELCLTYWSEAQAKWCVYVIDFNRDYHEFWSGDIEFSEAESLDDLLKLRITFPFAKEVSAGPTDVLGLVYDTHGNPYAIAFGGNDMAIFGGVDFYHDAVNVNFTPLADLDADLHQSAARLGARIGAFTPEADCATIVFASKSFVIDGELIEGILHHEYTINTSLPTAVERMTTSGKGATYTLDGRHATKYDIHSGRFCIDNGRKVIK